MSSSDIRPNEFEIWMGNYKAERREAEDEQSRQTDDVNSDLSPNDDEKAADLLKLAFNDKQPTSRS
jgi:hypothetical protein